MYKRLAVCFLLGSVASLFSPVLAKVSLPPLFSEGAVLQRGVKVSVWGSAAPNEAVNLKIGKQTKSTVANGGGQWSVKLDPLSPGNNYTLSVSSASSSVTRHVLVGDVLLCSGQSNMNLSIVESDSSDDDTQSPEKANVRVFRVKDKDSGQYSGLWVAPDATSIKFMPAIPYLVGRKLSIKAGVPVGVICAAASGAGLESFLPPETAKRFPKLEPNAENHFPVGRNFQVLLEPCLPYTVSTMLWYQGESNVLHSAEYRSIFPAFLSDIRTRLAMPKLPIYFVQLPGFGHYISNPQSSAWAELRESQSAAASIPDVFMTVSLDTVQDAPLHPPEKRVLASRLADIIGSKWSAPAKNSYSVHGDSMKIDIGDKSQAVHTDNQEDARGFQIAGADKHFQNATAEISEHSIVVKNEKIKHPMYVRYAWADAPDCNVKIGDLPLPPFRSDNLAH